MFKTRNLSITLLLILSLTLLVQTNEGYARTSLSQLQAQITALQTQLDALEGQVGVDVSDLQTQIDALQAQIDAIPAGPEGPQGPKGDTGLQGLQGQCDCPITQGDLDALMARLEILESFHHMSRFTDMGNGTIRDNESGLIWLKDASCSDLPPSTGNATWYTAKLEVAALRDGTCGLTDGSAAGKWRLPTKAEWEAFMSTCYGEDPALVNTVGNAQWSEGDAFTGVQFDVYWSSTEYDDGTSNRVWYANLDGGSMGHTIKDGGSPFVWPVRSDN